MIKTKSIIFDPMNMLLISNLIKHTTMDKCEIMRIV